MLNLIRALFYKLFVRASHGHYLFNPGLALKIGGEWIDIYDLASIERLACKPLEEKDWWREDHNARQEQRMAAQKDRLAQWLDSVKHGRAD